jgi:hypothetical protein
MVGAGVIGESFETFDIFDERLMGEKINLK